MSSEKPVKTPVIKTKEDSTPYLITHKTQRKILHSAQNVKKYINNLISSNKATLYKYLSKPGESSPAGVYIIRLPDNSLSYIRVTILKKKQQSPKPSSEKTRPPIPKPKPEPKPPIEKPSPSKPSPVPKREFKPVKETPAARPPIPKPKPEPKPPVKEKEPEEPQKTTTSLKKKRPEHIALGLGLLLGLAFLLR